ncbi:MAG: GtrA family protein [Dysgonamonadaceae bacterium]|jgi:putative flippase GtrA|nr:GtrA family protein [Dysgonamonadaceae bacterium]
MKNDFLIQTIKYGVVGVTNTLLTMVTIWVMMRVVFLSEEGEKISSLALSVSNTVGYIVGLINSFIWNRSWTFKSKNKWTPDFIRFMIAFLVCFIIQLVLVNVLYKRMEMAGLTEITGAAEICQFAGIVVYTILNFILNKYFTFKIKNR